MEAQGVRQLGRPALQVQGLRQLRIGVISGLTLKSRFARCRRAPPRSLALNASPPAPDSAATDISSFSLPSGKPANFLRAVLALGVGGFAIGTGEFVIMGLLPEVAKDIGV
eukprot:gene41381-54848_t